MASRLLAPTVVAAVLAAALTAGNARADPSAADRETARQLMEAGRALRAKNDLKGALQRFKAADDIMHVPTTGLEVARTQVPLGLLVEARDAIAKIRLIPVKPNEPEPFKEARLKAEQLDASLEGRVPEVTIQVHGAPSGQALTVSIDGTSVPAAVVGLPRAIDPGHHVVAVKTDAAAGQQDVDVHEGEKKAVDVTLAPSPTAQAAAPPQAGPATEQPVEEHAESPAPTTISHGPDVLTYVGGALAVAGLAAGTVTGAMSWSKTSSLASACPDHACPSSSFSTYDSASSLATISTLSFVAGGVGACLAVISIVIGHEDKSEPGPSSTTGQLRVSPWIGATGAGLRGSF